MEQAALREELQTIYDEHGRLTPELVRDTAKDENHPLHPEFDWDDSTAADSWRLEQAHRLIRIARVVYKPADEFSGARSVRAYHAVRGSSGYVYEPAERVATDPFLRRLVLKDMEREWQALKRRYAQFDEFSAMIRSDIEGAA